MTRLSHALVSRRPSAYRAMTRGSPTLANAAWENQKRPSARPVSPARLVQIQPHDTSPEFSPTSPFEFERSEKDEPRARLAPWRRRRCDAVFSCGSDLTCAGLPQQQP
jgi:hypothetical protein